MKRKGGLFHQVSDWDALLAATRRAARGKRHRPDVAGRWFGGEHRRQRQRLLIPPPQRPRHRRPADALGAARNRQVVTQVLSMIRNGEPKTHQARNRGSSDPGSVPACCSGPQLRGPTLFTSPVSPPSFPLPRTPPQHLR